MVSYNSRSSLGGGKNLEGDHDDKKLESYFLPDRRSTLIQAIQTVTVISIEPKLSDASSVSSDPFTIPSTTTTKPFRADLPPITHKVFMDVRIARSDGTFYVRDDPLGTIPTPDNQVFYGHLILGLFGTIAPSHVEKFLKYVSPTTSMMMGEYDESPLPSYSRSVFKSLDQRTGLLIGGSIPGLDKTTIGGSPALQYGSRIIPAQLWIDKTPSTSNRIYHTRGNLLTHRNLDVSPEFGITTRAAPELDSTHTVFGCLLSNDDAAVSSKNNDNKAFLERIIDLPTYSMDRPTTIEIENDGGVIVDAASNLYTIQRDFFRQAAKTFGDSRLDKTFEGKLLRRAEVTQVGVVN